MKKQLLTALSCTAFSMAASTMAYSSNPPANLAISNVPQFVIIGADDCGNGEMVSWIANFVNSKKNPAGKGNAGTFDGMGAKMAFYVNGTYASEAGASWKAAYLAGNEIGNHTFSHFLDTAGEPVDARLLSKEIWAAEIAKNDSVLLETIGLPKSELVGFRVPRLEYNRDAFLAMTERGFLYDCSVEEGGEEGMNGTNNYWPYTMENGSQADSIMTLQSVGEADWGYKQVGKIPGLWQLPVYNYVVPHDSLASKYGFKKGLRNRIHKNFDYFDVETGNLTGFDYNIFAPADWDGAAMSAAEFLATLKYSFDLHLNGNRAPFTLGMHPDFYSEATNEDYKSAGDHLSRRKVIEDFINYALTKSDVRFITGAQMINWMQNPVGLDGTSAK